MIHRTLDGYWAECPSPDTCQLKFHFSDMSLEAARQMPLVALLPLLEIFDPPTTTLTDGSKAWEVSLPNNPEMQGCHRDYDLPAIVWQDGGLEWCLNGQTNRLHDQPSMVDSSGYRQWHHNGLLHRAGGKPAVIWPDGGVEYWVEGVQVNADGTLIHEISMVLSGNRAGRLV